MLATEARPRRFRSGKRNSISAVTRVTVFRSMLFLSLSLGPTHPLSRCSSKSSKIFREARRGKQNDHVRGVPMSWTGMLDWRRNRRKLDVSLTFLDDAFRRGEIAIVTMVSVVNADICIDKYD